MAKRDAAAVFRTIEKLKAQIVRCKYEDFPEQYQQIANLLKTLEAFVPDAGLAVAEKDLVRRGLKVEAIRGVRRRTGLPLVESKALVDRYANNC